MEHSFDVEVAQKYGIAEAVLLNNITFWIAKNHANEEHFYEGRYWTFNSIKAFGELFPYLSEKQIRHALNHLIEENVLITGNFNQKSYDITLWYGFSDRYLAICPLGKMDLPSRENGFAPQGKPIPYINTDIKENISTNVDIPKEKVFSFDKHTNKENLLHIFESDTKYSKLAPDFRQALIDWCEYKDERKPKKNNHYTEKGLNMWITQTINSAMKYGANLVVIQIRKAIASQWQGTNYDMLENLNRGNYNGRY